MQGQNKEVNKMSPRTGRPPVMVNQERKSSIFVLQKKKKDA